MRARQPERRRYSDKARQSRSETAQSCGSLRSHRPEHLTVERLAQVVLAVMVVSRWCSTPVHAADTAPFVVSGSTAAPGITKLFSRTNGWIGGDGAYSVRLDREKALWTFGDTWIGRIRDGKRVDCSMINNSAAVQSLGSDGRIEFLWRSKDGKPTALWKPNHRGTYYWPGDAAKIDGKLYVFLHVIKPKPQAAPPFQFEHAEDVMMRIDNPLASPLAWSHKMASLGNGSTAINFGIACWMDDKYLYSFCSYPSAGKGFEKHPTIVARIQKNALTQLDMSKWEYWCRSAVDGHRRRWQRQLADPVILIPDGAPEMSVCKMRNIPGLLATYMPAFTRKIFIRHAINPEGPWSEPVLAYSAPESEKGILLYSAKAHPEQPCGSDELVITYCRNSMDFAWHISRPDIYFPQAIIVRLQPIAQNIAPRQ